MVALVSISQDGRCRLYLNHKCLGGWWGDPKALVLTGDLDIYRVEGYRREATPGRVGSHFSSLLPPKKPPPPSPFRA